MYKQFILLILPYLLFSSCQKSKTNSIVIEIYQTENTYTIYKNLYDCDSMRMASVPVIKTDSTSLESIVYANSVPPPIVLERLMDVIRQEKDGGYILNNKALIGKAKISDTASMNPLLSGIDCNSDKANGYKYTWVAIPDDTEYVYLAGLKKALPIVVLKADDIDSLTFTPASTFLGIIDEITKGKKEPSAYALNVVLNQRAAQLLKSELNKDTLAGYFMVITSGTYKDLIPLKNPVMNKQNTLEKLSLIATDEVNDFKKKVDFDIFVIK